MSYPMPIFGMDELYRVFPQQHPTVATADFYKKGIDIYKDTVLHEIDAHADSVQDLFEKGFPPLCVALCLDVCAMDRFLSEALFRLRSFRSFVVERTGRTGPNEPRYKGPCRSRSSLVKECCRPCMDADLTGACIHDGNNTGCGVSIPACFNSSWFVSVQGWRCQGGMYSTSGPYKKW